MVDTAVAVGIIIGFTFGVANGWFMARVQAATDRLRGLRKVPEDELRQELRRRGRREDRREG
jgi:hypothetical protein